MKNDHTNCELFLCVVYNSSADLSDITYARAEQGKLSFRCTYTAMFYLPKVELQIPYNISW